MSQAASLCLGHRSQNCPIVDRKCCQRVELSPFTKRMNRNVYISIWETRSSRSQTAGNWQLFSRHSPLARRGPPSLPRAAPGTEVPPPARVNMLQNATFFQFFENSKTLVSTQGLISKYFLLFIPKQAWVAS